MKEAELEIQLSEKANQEAMQKNKYQSEFLARLDFLVTFLAMKKVITFAYIYGLSHSRGVQHPH
jgi:hypothetical protein